MSEVTTSTGDPMDIDEDTPVVSGSETDMQSSDHKQEDREDHDHEDYPHSEEDSEVQESSLICDGVSGIRVQDIPLPDYSPPAMQHSPPSSTVDTSHDNSSPLQRSPLSSTLDHHDSSNSSSQDGSIPLPEDSPPLPADTPTLTSSTSSSSQNTPLPADTPPLTTCTPLVPYTSPSSSENTPTLPADTPPLPPGTPPLPSSSPTYRAETTLSSASPSSPQCHLDTSPLPAETSPLPSGSPLSPRHAADSSPLPTSAPTPTSNTPPLPEENPVTPEEEASSKYHDVMSDNEENMDSSACVVSPQHAGKQVSSPQYSPQSETIAAEQFSPQTDTFTGETSPKTDTFAGEISQVETLAGKHSPQVETFVSDTSPKTVTYEGEISPQRAVETSPQRETFADDSSPINRETLSPPLQTNEEAASPQKETSFDDSYQVSVHQDKEKESDEKREENLDQEMIEEKDRVVENKQVCDEEKPEVDMETRSVESPQLASEIGITPDKPSCEESDTIASVVEPKQYKESPSDPHKDMSTECGNTDVEDQLSEVKETSMESSNLVPEDLEMTCEDETPSFEDDYQSKINVQKLSEDEDGFRGFDGEEIVGPVTLDFTNLNFTQEDLDAVDIMGLEEDWWKNPYLHRADSESNFDNASIVGDIIPSSAASITSAASSPSSQMSGSSSRRRGSPGKQRDVPSITSPAFKKPFQFGFKREIVYRGTVDGRANNSGLADVYYYSPEGRKFRSYREIASYLEENNFKLTTNNFTFNKEPIGMQNPDVEMIREAKKKESIAASTKRSAKTPLEKVVSPKVPKLKISTKSVVTPPNEPVKLVPPLRISTASGSRRSPSGGRAKGAAARARAACTEESAAKTMISPCSIDCASALGLIPSLQCTACVCLYHPVCVGLAQVSPQFAARYTCPNCSGDQVIPQPAAAPLTFALPPLQRLPRPGEHSTVTLTPTMPMLQRFVQPPTPEAGGKILYSLSNWRPPPLTNIRPNMEQVAPQSLAFMNGKKYIVIPKNNAMNASSVSPDSGDTLDANKPFSPPPLNMLGQSSVILSAPTTPANPLMPKSAILVNQPAGPGTPGGMFLMTPAENQDHNPAQIMLFNSAASVLPGMQTLLAATPSTSTGLPRMAEEGAAEERNIRIVGKKPPSMSGYTFTEKLGAMYEGLLGVFRYLTVQELLRASRVCKIWRQVAQHESLWLTVRMKNSQVKSWQGCISTLVRQRTTHLDLRKMLLPKREEEAQAMWSEFCGALQEWGTSLERIDLCRCPSSVVASVAETCPHIKQLCATAITVKSDSLDLQSMSNLHLLHGLRLKSFHGMELLNFQVLGTLNNLQQLSLTSIRMLPAAEVCVALTGLPKLELLELGDCSGLLSKASLIAKALSHLKQLQRLRLEKLVSDDKSEQDSMKKILMACSTLPKLSHMELINIEAGPGCDEAIAACTNLRQLLLVPSYISHGARTCQIMLRGILHLKGMQNFVWIVTNEVIGVTRKLMKSKHVPGKSDTPDTEECIPFLTPVPNANRKSLHGDDKKSSVKVDKLEILPLYKLRSIISLGLPTAKISVKKVAFQATWRHTLCDFDL